RVRGFTECVFLPLVRRMLDGIFLCELRTDFACYRIGERARITALIHNVGERKWRIQVKFIVRAWRKRKPIAIHTTVVHIAPRDFATAEVEHKVTMNDDVLYHVTAQLIRDGKVIDQCETGFVVWSERVLTLPPKFAYRNNYFHLNGKPIFLLGTDTYSNLFTSPSHNPLTWARMIEKARDFGVLVVETLQPAPRTDNWDERMWRNLDAFILLNQWLGTIYMAGLLIGHNVILTDADLARQARYCRRVAQRYKDASRLIYYLNGDYRLQLFNHSDITTAFNRFLRERYRMDDALREAWGDATLRIGDVAIPKLHELKRTFDDVRMVDLSLFKCWMLRRWNEALVRAIREVDSVHPITCEYYRTPFGGIDIVATIDGLNVANIGYFDLPRRDLIRFPAVFKFTDMRMRGKSLNIGEFGVKTHPAWALERGGRGYHIKRTEAEQRTLFILLPHYAFALGGSKVQNWCWQDDYDRVFPWGLNYPCDDVEKDALKVYRCMGYLLGQLEPVWRAPQVVLITPDSHRAGQSLASYEATVTALHHLICTHIDFAVVNECALVKLKPPVKVAFLPAPFALSDHAFAKLQRFVEEGGVLYISGDFSWDEFRRRSREGRLHRLAGVECIKLLAVPDGNAPKRKVVPASDAVLLPAYEGNPCMRIRVVDDATSIIQRTEDGEPVTIVHRFGRGRVIFTTDAWEMRIIVDGSDGVMPYFGAGGALYRYALRLAGIAPIDVHPDIPAIHTFTQPTRFGIAIVAINMDSRAHQIRLRHKIGTRTIVIETTLAPERPVLVAFDNGASLRCIEATNSIRINGVEVANGDGLFAIASLDRADISHSRSLLILPMECTRLSIHRTAPIKSPLIIGELRNGRWHVLERIETLTHGDYAKWDIPSDLTMELGRCGIAQVRLW
ncbi:MAG TPA: hypothetical protein EYP10_03030, partial [Armatimonadetes bacterium]|nr:hypothetical protein [Armatimonadota bacterium]